MSPALRSLAIKALLLLPHDETDDTVSNVTEDDQLEALSALSRSVIMYQRVLPDAQHPLVAFLLHLTRRNTFGNHQFAEEHRSNIAGLLWCICLIFNYGFYSQHPSPTSIEALEEFKTQRAMYMIEGCYAPTSILYRHQSFAVAAADSCRRAVDVRQEGHGCISISGRQLTLTKAIHGIHRLIVHVEKAMCNMLAPNSLDWLN